MLLRRAVLVVILVGCGTSEPPPDDPCVGPAFDGAPLSIRCGRLVDRDGREVMLHGINARIRGLFDNVLPDGELALGTLPEWTATDAAEMRAMGFNALRLPVNWSGLEPTEDGGFDAAYVDRIAAVVDACRAAGVWVLVDFHQDGYTKHIGDDGAPLWATLPTPPPRDPDDPNRNVSPAAQAAFRTFFGPSADGIRLRARFAAMVDHVATRFAGDDTVLGYELLNEPIASADELAAFHRELIASLRVTAPDKLIVFEPIAVRNVLDSAVPGDGSLGPGTVYAPHVYTGVFAAAPRPLTKEILEFSNASARAEADGWEAPLVITEWGFGPSDDQYADFVQWQQELQDQYLASSFYWVWKEYGATSWGFYSMDDATGAATPRSSTIAQFARLRPEAIAGTLTAIAHDPATRTLEVTFTGRADLTVPNRISLAGAASLAATCDGQAVPAVVSGATAEIDCSGAGVHVLRATSAAPSRH